MLPAARVHLVVALRAEAEPLIEHFELSASQPGGAFREFSRADGGIGLVVSGSGRISAAAAVASIARVRDAAWLNIGVAGHAEHRIGSPFLAHRVVDDALDRAWYPPLVFEPPCPTASVRTVDRPCIDFPTDDLYDMEAAGFYEIAARFARHELVHCLKVVSDNRDQPASTLTRERVVELIGSNVAVIDSIVGLLHGLSTDQQQERAEPAGFEAILARAHFTTTERRQLRRLLRRFAALCPTDNVVAWSLLVETESAGEILARLEAHLGQQAPRFADTP